MDVIQAAVLAIMAIGSSIAVHALIELRGGGALRELDGWFGSSD